MVDSHGNIAARPGFIGEELTLKVLAVADEVTSPKYSVCEMIAEPSDFVRTDGVTALRDIP